MPRDFTFTTTAAGALILAPAASTAATALRVTGVPDNVPAWKVHETLKGVTLHPWPESVSYTLLAALRPGSLLTRSQLEAAAGRGEARLRT